MRIAFCQGKLSVIQKSLEKNVQRVDASEQDDAEEEELVCSGSHMCYIIGRKKTKILK